MSGGTDAAGEGTADGFPVMTLPRLLTLMGGEQSGFGDAYHNEKARYHPHR